MELFVQINGHEGQLLLFGARFDMTEWHIHYGGRGVMIYWHVERSATCTYSQIK